MHPWKVIFLPNQYWISLCYDINEIDKQRKWENVNSKDWYENLRGLLTVCLVHPRAKGEQFYYYRGLLYHTDSQHSNTAVGFSKKKKMKPKSEWEC